MILLIALTAPNGSNSLQVAISAFTLARRSLGRIVCLRAFRKVTSAGHKNPQGEPECLADTFGHIVPCGDARFSLA
jgi:hypothetical protein